MINMNINRILEQIARKHGTTPEAVRREIQQAIDAAFDNPPDDLAAYRIRRIPCKGARPTPEEAIAYLSGQAADRK